MDLSRMETVNSVGRCIHSVRCVLGFLVRALFGCVFAFLQMVNFMDPGKRCRDTRNREACVVRSSILMRWKIALIDSAGVSDFLLWRKPELYPLDVLLKEGVSLYCLTPDHVMFIRTPPGVDCCSSKTSPFFYQTQFHNAEEAYMTSHHWFHVLSSEIAEGCQVPVTWMSNTGRCGSTMLSQIMEGVPGTVCFSEPDAIFSVAMMKHWKSITPDQQLPLVRSTILMLLYHAKSHAHVSSSHWGTRHVFIKPRSECLLLFREIHKAFPWFRHIFMSRRQQQWYILSGVQLVKRIALLWPMLVNSDRLAAITPRVRLFTFQLIFYGSDEERELLADLISSVHFPAYIAMKSGSQMKEVQQLQAEGLSVPVLFYEDLLADPAATASSLFDHLQLSQEHLDTALRSMSKESQAGAKGYVADEASRHRFTLRERQEINTVFSRFQLPSMEEDMKFAQTIGH